MWSLRLASLVSAGILAACSSLPAEDGDPAAGEDPGASPPSTDERSDPDPDPGSSGDPDAGSDAQAERYVDSCDLAAATCTSAPSGFKAGAGLTPIDRCAYELTESAGIAAPNALVDALAKIAPRVGVADVVGDANRTAVATGSVPGSPPGVQIAFRWNAEDEASTRWIPQGLSGSADGDPTGVVGGKRIVLSSFYDSTGDKGVRIAFVDVTAKASPKYRYALLVTPSGTTSAPTFRSVRIHAGGIAWFGRYLYVADTTHGFRVFDLSSILKVATDEDTIGCTSGTCRAGLYKYVVPQVGKYEVASIDAGCEPIFSFVSLDRSSQPPSLVSGEYCNGTACDGPLAGRVFRWPLDPETSLLRSEKTFPTEAFFMGQAQVQGAAVAGGTFFLSSSAPAAGAGALYRVKQNASATSKWVDAPEDLMVDPSAKLLWSQSEAKDDRVVFGVSRTSYPAP